MSRRGGPSRAKRQERGVRRAHKPSRSVVGSRKKMIAARQHEQTVGVGRRNDFGSSVTQQVFLLTSDTAGMDRLNKADRSFLLMLVGCATISKQQTTRLGKIAEQFPEHAQ